MLGAVVAGRAGEGVINVVGLEADLQL